LDFIGLHIKTFLINYVAFLKLFFCFLKGIFVNMFVGRRHNCNQTIIAGLILLGSFSFCGAMFEKGDRCKIVRGYLKGGEVEIEGTCQQVFNIEDAEMLASNERLWKNSALANYLSICFSGVDESPCLGLLSAMSGVGDRVVSFIKEDCKGLFYYGKLLGSPRLGYCLNPMWLEKMTEASAAGKTDDRKIAATPYNDVEKRLFEIFREIRVIQYSCGHVGVRDYAVPLRCKGCSLGELQDRQRALFPEMRKLKAILPLQQVESISERADRAANAEIESTTFGGGDAGFGAAAMNRDQCSLQ
jgi:hypothetical protein